MLKQEIDLFNPSNDFYTDLCFHYNSPNNRDIPMRDRASFFYTNINKCGPGCSFQGIDFANAKFICECQFRSVSDIEEEGNINTETQSNIGFPKSKSSTNIEVIKCIRDVFNKKYFKDCAGGIIMLILSLCQISCMTVYFIFGKTKLKKHVFSLFQIFKNFSNSSKFNLKEIKNPMNNKKPKKLNEIKKSNNKLILDIKEEIDIIKNNINKIESQEKFGKLSEINENESYENNEKVENEDMYIKLIKEYTNEEFDECDFEDTLTKDKRTFLKFFTEKCYKNQIFINTFLIKHILKPLSLKIMLLVLIIELYFCLTALFYTEVYLSELFFSDEKDGFLSFITRRIYEIVFTVIICGIIGYLCSYFLDNDDHFKVLLTQKNNIKIKLALNQFLKNIKIKLGIFILISFVFTIFSFIYISCFNIVYPYIKNEWIKSSIIIFIFMQTIHVLSILIGTCFRYLSIKSNNLILFRISSHLY